VFLWDAASQSLQVSIAGDLSCSYVYFTNAQDVPLEIYSNRSCNFLSEIATYFAAIVSAVNRKVCLNVSYKIATVNADNGCCEKFAAMY